MALIKTTAFLAEIRGSVNGTVFSRNPYGAIARTKVTPVNPETLPQQAVRSMFAALIPQWSGLSDNQRKLWADLAMRLPQTNVFGDTYFLTGALLFTSFNRNLQEIGESVIEDAPPLEAVQAFESFSVDIVTTPGSEDITLNISPAIASGTKLIVYATPVVSSGVMSANKSLYRKITVLDNTFISGGSIENDYISVFGGSPRTGEKAFFSVRPIAKASGRALFPLYCSAIATA
ncbi:MAG: hypothetical protein KA792_06160 [Bacteroidales bacterium]|nr:hypothetical protein [Bacteroidales bacterium]